MIAKKLTDLIGKTPLLELGTYSAKRGIETAILAKVEYFNPGGSVKDRVALSMIEDAERKGLLKPGATIIEPTSGNTGVGLALVSAVKGYKLILTMPETMSVERRNLVKACAMPLRAASYCNSLKTLPTRRLTTTPRVWRYWSRPTAMWTYSWLA